MYDKNIIFKFLGYGNLKSTNKNVDRKIDS